MKSIGAFRWLLLASICGSIAASSLGKLAQTRSLAAASDSTPVNQPSLVQEKEAQTQSLLQASQTRLRAHQDIIRLLSQKLSKQKADLASQGNLLRKEEEVLLQLQQQGVITLKGFSVQEPQVHRDGPIRSFKPGEEEAASSQTSFEDYIPSTPSLDTISLIGAILLFLGVVALLTLACYNYGSTITGGFVSSIVDGVSELLGVQLMIGSMDIQLLSATIVLDDIIMHNPEGFTTPYLMKAKEVIISLDKTKLATSIFGGGEIALGQVKLLGVEVMYETHGQVHGLSDLSLTKGSNVQAVLKAIDENTPEFLKKHEDSPKPPPGPARTVTLKELHIEGVKVSTKSEVLGQFSMPVPTIKYPNFSEKFGTNTTIGHVVKTILQEIFADALRSRMRSGCC